MKEFHTWRQSKFNRVSEYSWRVKSQVHENQIRDELAQHGGIIGKLAARKLHAITAVAGKFYHYILQ